MKIRLSEYDKKWIQLFEDEAEFLAGIFKDEVVNFEHFGSTAVPDMKAKPVIDMMCLVKDIEKIDLFNSQLQLHGYDVAGEWGIPGRRLFRKGGDNRTHHVHVYQHNHPQIRRHLVFRDYLRTHPDEVERYSGFKEKLAERYDETSLYSKAKKPFIKEMEQQALDWFENKGTKSSF
ncbi:GrpB family protein [Sporosarcina gallistercoris]|uniref:GrpB family protein n=1 Tax=Sporosarcina gallistercoris TaxID=2762245 RepID=UPI003D2DDB4F